MELMAADVVLRATGFDTVENLLSRVEKNFVQLTAVIGTATSAVEQSARRSAAASQLKADYAKQAADETVAALTMEQRAANALNEIRERSAQAEKRRRAELAKPYPAGGGDGTIVAPGRATAAPRATSRPIISPTPSAADTNAAKMRGGMIASQLLIGLQDGITVYQNGGGLSRAVMAGFNNVIQAAALTGPYGAIAATVGVVGVQAWQMVSASMNQEAEKAKEHANSLREILAGAIATGISGSRFSPGGGNEFLDRYRDERKEADLLRQTLADLAAERAKLSAERPELARRAQALANFQPETVEKLDDNIAKDKALAEKEMEAWKKFQEVDQSQKNMQARLPSARRDAASENRFAAMSEVWMLAGQGGQAVIDRKDQVDKQLNGLKGSLAAFEAAVSKTTSDSEKAMLTQLIETTTSESKRLIELKRQLQSVYQDAKDDVEMRNVEKFRKAQLDHEKESELQETLGRYRRDAAFLNTEDKARAEISVTRKAYETAAQQPDFKEADQRYYQGKLAIQYGQLEKILSEKARPADTEKKLERLDNARVGQQFGDELGRVMNKDGLQALIKKTRDDLASADSAGTLTPQAQENYLARIQQMQARVDSLNSQEVVDDRQKQIQRAVKGAQARTYDLSGYGRSITEMAASGDPKDIEKKMLRELGKSVSLLENLLKESQKSKGGAVF